MTSPKLPTPKKVNPYEGMTSDPEFAAAAKELGYSKVNKDREVAKVREYMLRNKIDIERKNKTFLKAERQLYKEGILETNDPFYDKKTFKEHYIQKNNLTGKNAEKKAAKAYKEMVAEGGKNFMHRDDTDTEFELQKIYDRMYDIESAKAEKQYNRQLQKQANQYIKVQEKAQRQSQKQFKQQLKAQQESQDAMAAQQRELMEEMMNQPIYSAQQAALPKVQQQAKTPAPIPVAPAPPAAMNISTAPAPELVNLGNPMGIVRQSSTSRNRGRQRTRGTSSLT